MRRLLLVTAVALLTGCAIEMSYEEPILSSCGHLTGDLLQDVCHTSVYRVPIDDRSGDLVESIRRALGIEGD